MLSTGYDMVAALLSHSMHGYLNNSCTITSPMAFWHGVGRMGPWRELRRPWELIFVQGGEVIFLWWYRH